jgi:hypothetical protein
MGIASNETHFGIVPAFTFSPQRCRQTGLGKGLNWNNLRTMIREVEVSSENENAWKLFVNPMGCGLDRRNVKIPGQ